MQPKHLECIKVLVGLALTEGDYLAESWVTVLEVVSQLQRLQLLSAAGLTDDGFFHNGSGSRDASGGSNHGSSNYNYSSGSSVNSSSTSSSSGLHKFFYGPSKAEVARVIEETNAAQVRSNLRASSC
jgi:brefeldin A-inhibited guanine nucleotide-exchange protein